MCALRLFYQVLFQILFGTQIIKGVPAEKWTALDLNCVDILIDIFIDIEAYI